MILVAGSRLPDYTAIRPQSVFDPLGETLTPGESKATSDFVTVYNFYGLVDG